MFFDETIHCRIDTKTRKMLEDIYTKDPNKYENLSHVIRCAIIKLHRDEL